MIPAIFTVRIGGSPFHSLPGGSSATSLPLTPSFAQPAFACVGPNPGPLLPCGRCRQLLHEHGGDGMLIDRAGGPVTLGTLIPDAFGPEAIP